MTTIGEAIDQMDESRHNPPQRECAWCLEPESKNAKLVKVFASNMLSQCYDGDLFHRDCIAECSVRGFSVREAK